ncbi:MAG: HemK2/MTQ2 family protein methyltransferase [Candidatus Pacearchaeota archaeon]|jgi:release factor glutamine methyltransferase
MAVIYQPAEDSYLLAGALEDYLKSLKNPNKKIKILDMGSGSGIQAETCKKLKFENILVADISPDVIEHLKKSGFKVVQTDLFSKINKKDKFDLVIFNPPYLPEDKDEPEDSKLATTAGKEGNEIIIKFLKQAKNHLTKQGVILLLISSLSKPHSIKKQIKALNYKSKLIDNQKLFFEELYVYLLRI